MTRQPFPERCIRLVSQLQVDTAKALLDNVPRDPVKPIVCIFKEEPKTRSPDANARLWAGPLRDMQEQAWLRGRQYSAETWHEFMKCEYLPDPDVFSVEELALRVRNPETYRKWAIAPNGDRLLVGSTTQLTPFGFSEYLEQITAFGSELGVQFSASPREFERQP